MRRTAGFHPRLTAFYGAVTAPLERFILAPARARLLAGATGRVLEIGAGTGANLAWYPPTVHSVALCEPDPQMRRRLIRRVAAEPWPFTVTVHAADALGPFPSDDYDVIVSTLVLCTVPDPNATAAALAAVLAEGGRVAYLEHVHVGGVLGRLQSALSPRWARAARRPGGSRWPDTTFRPHDSPHLAGGCHLDRQPTAAWRAAGLVPIEQRWLILPPPLLRAVAGHAIVRRRPSAPVSSPARLPL